jgi:Arc/MetJ family transcription regulator
MRINIIIDNKLMHDAASATGLKSNRELVKLGLKTLIRLKQQEGIKALKGNLKWEGDSSRCHRHLRLAARRLGRRRFVQG